jgi:hypothetical protein
MHAAAAASLSPAYHEIKQLRSRGHCAAAIAKLRTTRPAGDLDAFEAVVCLFVCGEFDGALNVCHNHPWRAQWTRDIAGALSESLRQGDANRATTR